MPIESIPVDWTYLISNIGFPIFVVWWFMNRLERKLDKLTDVLRDLKNEIRNRKRI